MKKRSTSYEVNPCFKAKSNKANIKTTFTSSEILTCLPRVYGPEKIWRCHQEDLLDFFGIYNERNMAWAAVPSSWHWHDISLLEYSVRTYRMWLCICKILPYTSLPSDPTLYQSEQGHKISMSSDGAMHWRWKCFLCYEAVRTVALSTSPLVCFRCISISTDNVLDMTFFDAMKEKRANPPVMYRK